jgi:type III pantothenate kinase
MILCLDVGNTQIYAGLIKAGEITHRFRYPTADKTQTSDLLGVFLRSVLRENEIDHQQIDQVAIASVVPDLEYSIRSAVIKYLNCEPFFLQAGVKTGLQIKTSHPAQVGADIIAGAIAAVHHYQGQNIIVVDMGTATTITAVNKGNCLLGVTIFPGCTTSMRALRANAAKLPAVEITRPARALGRETTESIQSGLYLMQAYSIKQICQRIIQEEFPEEDCIVVGTGGFANLFANDAGFDKIHQDLVLEGIYLALHKNS